MRARVVVPPLVLVWMSWKLMDAAWPTGTRSASRMHDWLPTDCTPTSVYPVLHTHESPLNSMLGSGHVTQA